MENNFHFRSKISREEIALLPRRKFIGEIFYIDSREALIEFLPEIREEKILGFDTETRPAFKKGIMNEVALLQLSSSQQAFLFRLNRIGLPEELVSILIDPSVVKTGVAIHDDIAALQKLNNFRAEGFIDLQDYVKEFGIEDKGLKKLTANVLGFQISKRQQTSNWEMENLSRSQIEYAATDAWVCYEIYMQLLKAKRYNGQRR
jgi:ribonuclease D